jgi:hypothetical protein
MYLFIYVYFGSWDGVIDAVTGLLDSRETVVPHPAEAGGFSLVRGVQTDSGTYPASSSISTGAVSKEVRSNY